MSTTEGVMTDLPQMIKDNITITGSCHIWEGYIHNKYPRCKILKKEINVRRTIYEAHNGPHKGYLILASTCGNNLCVSHQHLCRKTDASNRSKVVDVVTDSIEPYLDEYESSSLVDLIPWMKEDHKTMVNSMKKDNFEALSPELWKASKFLLKEYCGIDRNSGPILRTNLWISGEGSSMRGSMMGKMGDSS